FKIPGSFSMTTSSTKNLKIPGKTNVEILFSNIKKTPKTNIFRCGRMMVLIIFESDATITRFLLFLLFVQRSFSARSRKAHNTKEFLSNHPPNFLNFRVWWFQHFLQTGLNAAPNSGTQLQFHFSSIHVKSHFFFVGFQF